ncbi:MAG: hypothetical protein HDR21_03760 [Lachnospiraceae bacterium]|nr:hypothetical protein [Lachnospiraceae bacterium]
MKRKMSAKYQIYVLRWNDIKKLEDEAAYTMWYSMRQYRNFHMNALPGWAYKRRKLHDFMSDKPLLCRMWYPIYLNQLQIDKRNANIIVINDVHPCINNVTFLRYLKRKYHARLVLLIVNQIADKKHPRFGRQDLDKLRSIFDVMVSADRADAERFSLEYVPNIYSKRDFCGSKKAVSLYYTGKNKSGREQILTEFVKRLREAGISFSFSLTGVSDTGKRKGIKEKAFRGYPEILREVQDAECLLEILEDRQTSMTLRYMEALCYNKKLLTNNQNIIHLAGYDERYMRIFDPNHVEDIDLEFVRQRVDVKYDYNNEYSPENFMRKVLKLLRERKLI